MTETEIGALLVDAFQKQTSLYKELELINCGFEKRLNKRPEKSLLSSFIQEKKHVMNRVSEIDVLAGSAKEEWRARKSDWKDPVVKLKIEEAITVLSGQMSKTIESEKRVEEGLKKASPLKNSTVSQKYKTQNLDPL